MDSDTPEKGFRRLLVWQKAQDLFVWCVKDSDGFPTNAAGRLVAEQLIRAVGSIGACVAEGYDRHGTKDYLYFLRTARASAHEAQDWCLKAERLGWLSGQIAGERVDACAELSKMLNSMIVKIQGRAKE